MINSKFVSYFIHIGSNNILFFRFATKWDNRGVKTWSKLVSLLFLRPIVVMSSVHKHDEQIRKEEVWTQDAVSGVRPGRDPPFMDKQSKQGQHDFPKPHEELMSSLKCKKTFPYTNKYKCNWTRDPCPQHIRSDSTVRILPSHDIFAF